MQNSQNRLIDLPWIVEIFLKDSLAVEKENCDLVSTSFNLIFFFKLDQILMHCITSYHL